MAADDAWKVLEHGPIVKLAENLWWVSGSVPNMTLRRTMAVVRLRDGDLLLHSAIAMDEAAMRELRRWADQGAIGGRSNQSFYLGSCSSGTATRCAPTSSGSPPSPTWCA